MIELRGKTITGDIVSVPANIPIVAESRVDLLNQLKEHMVGCCAAEIGIYEAAFTKTIHEILKPSKLLAIDDWSCENPEQHENISGLTLSGRRGVVVVKASSKVAAVDVKDSSLDFIYLDAEHTEQAVYDDIVLWWSKLKHGGFFAGHDFCFHNVWRFGTVYGVSRFVKEYKIKTLGMTNYSEDEFPSFVIEKSRK